MKRKPLGQHEKRTVVGNWNRWIWVRRARLFLVPPLCWIQAEKDGGPVLVTESSWRKISGLQMHVGTWQIWVKWRRFER